jgi:hypothetical protein
MEGAGLLARKAESGTAPPLRFVSHARVEGRSSHVFERDPGGE